jgi:hypothetical protein
MTATFWHPRPLLVATSRSLSILNQRNIWFTNTHTHKQCVQRSDNYCKLCMRYRNLWYRLRNFSCPKCRYVVPTLCKVCIAVYNELYRQRGIIILQRTPNNNISCTDWIIAVVPYVELSHFSWDAKHNFIDVLLNLFATLTYVSDSCQKRVLMTYPQPHRLAVCITKHRRSFIQHDVKTWIRFIWLRTGRSGGFF